MEISETDGAGADIGLVDKGGWSQGDKNDILISEKESFF